MKIITLNWLLKNTYNIEVRSMKSLNEFLERDIKPFMDIKTTNAEFSGIPFAGCGTMEDNFMYDLVKIFRSHYAGLFSTPITAAEIGGVGFPEDLNFILGQEDDNSYYIKFMNRRSLEDFLVNNLPDARIREGIKNLYQQHLMDSGTVRRKLELETGICRELIRLWESSRMKHLNLSPVGITIATTFFEQATGGNVHLASWIS